MKVLAIAELANPEWVSVPLVGWSLFNALRQVADVHLVTQIRNRDAILRAGLVEGRDFTALDTEVLEYPLWKIKSALRLGWTTKMALSSLSYPYFERLAWKRFGDEIQAGQFDVVHRITPLSPTTNSPIAARCADAGVPFVVGPLNGGVPWPSGFDAARRREKEWLSYVRGAYKISPARRRMLEATDVILAGSKFTASEIPDGYQDRCLYLPENAIQPGHFGRDISKAPAPPLRACFVGRLVPYKGLDMLLEAAEPLLRAGQLVLDIIGDGEMMEETQAFVDRHNLHQAVTLHGWLKHEQVPDVLGQAHVLSFPSIREFGGGVVLEAMALGVVPIVVNYGGPGELVTPATGLTIPIGSRGEIIAGMRAHLERIVADPKILPPMAEAAHNRAMTQFTWSAKADQVLQAYEWALARRENGGMAPEKPCLIQNEGAVRPAN